MPSSISTFKKIRLDLGEDPKEVEKWEKKEKRNENLMCLSVLVLSLILLSFLALYP